MLMVSLRFIFAKNGHHWLSDWLFPKEIQIQNHSFDLRR